MASLLAFITLAICFELANGYCLPETVANNLEPESYIISFLNPSLEVCPVGEVRFERFCQMKTSNLSTISAIGGDYFRSRCSIARLANDYAIFNEYCTREFFSLLQNSNLQASIEYQPTYSHNCPVSFIQNYTTYKQNDILNSNYQFKINDNIPYKCNYNHVKSVYVIKSHDTHKFCDNLTQSFVDGIKFTNSKSINIDYSNKFRRRLMFKQINIACHTHFTGFVNKVHNIEKYTSAPSISDIQQISLSTHKTFDQCVVASVARSGFAIKDFKHMLSIYDSPTHNSTCVRISAGVYQLFSNNATKKSGDATCHYSWLKHKVYRESWIIAHPCTTLMSLKDGKVVSSTCGFMPNSYEPITPYKSMTGPYMVLSDSSHINTCTNIEDGEQLEYSLFGDRLVVKKENFLKDYEYHEETLISCSSLEKVDVYVADKGHMIIRKARIRSRRSIEQKEIDEIRNLQREFCNILFGNNNILSSPQFLREYHTLAINNSNLHGTYFPHPYQRGKVIFVIVCHFIRAVYVVPTNSCLLNIKVKYRGMNGEILGGYLDTDTGEILKFSPVVDCDSLQPSIIQMSNHNYTYIYGRLIPIFFSVGEMSYTELLNHLKNSMKTDPLITYLMDNNLTTPISYQEFSQNSINSQFARSQAISDEDINHVDLTDELDKEEQSNDDISSITHLLSSGISAVGQGVSNLISSGSKTLLGAIHQSGVTDWISKHITYIIVAASVIGGIILIVICVLIFKKNPIRDLALSMVRRQVGLPPAVGVSGEVPLPVSGPT